MLVDLCRSGSSSRAAKLRLCKDVVAAAQAASAEMACTTLSAPALAVHAAWACVAIEGAETAAEFVSVTESVVQAMLDAGRGTGRSVRRHDDTVMYGAALALHGCAALAVPPTIRGGEGGDASEPCDKDAGRLIKEGLSCRSGTVSRFLPVVQMCFYES